MKKFVAIVAIALGFVLTSTDAFAAGYANPFGVPSKSHPFDRWFKQKPLPAFQAAPWYTYWPYNNHFMTPAPIPGYGGGPADFNGGQSGYGMNPYFPTQPGK
jgi:hypothetical protein